MNKLVVVCVEIFVMPILSISVNSSYNPHECVMQVPHRMKYGDGACDASIKKSSPCIEGFSAINTPKFYAHGGACHAFSGAVVTCCLEHTAKGESNDQIEKDQIEKCIINFCSKNFANIIEPQCRAYNAEKRDHEPKGWAYPHIAWDKIETQYFDDFDDSLYIEKKHKTLDQKQFKFKDNQKQFLWNMRNRFALRKSRVLFFLRIFQPTKDAIVGRGTDAQWKTARLNPNFPLCQLWAFKLETRDSSYKNSKDKAKDYCLLGPKQGERSWKNLLEYWSSQVTDWIFLEDSRFDDLLENQQHQLDLIKRFMPPCGESIQTTMTRYDFLQKKYVNVKDYPCVYHHIARYQLKDMEDSTCVRVDFRFVSHYKTKNNILHQIFSDEYGKGYSEVLAVAGIRSQYEDLKLVETGQMGKTYAESFHYVPVWQTDKGHFCLLDGYFNVEKEGYTPIWCVTEKEEGVTQVFTNKNKDDYVSGFLNFKDIESKTIDASKPSGRVWEYDKEGFGRLIACAKTDRFADYYFRNDKQLLWAHAERIKKKTKGGFVGHYAMNGVGGKDVERAFEEVCGGGGISCTKHYEHEIPEVVEVAGYAVEQTAKDATHIFENDFVFGGEWDEKENEKDEQDLGLQITSLAKNPTEKYNKWIGNGNLGLHKNQYVHSGDVETVPDTTVKKLSPAEGGTSLTQWAQPRTNSGIGAPLGIYPRKI